MNEPQAPQPRTVPCPTCRGPSVYSPHNAFRPFCSERCKNIDFGAWASEAFRVEPGPAAEDSAENQP
ncbi:MAG: DNA gyrase inhibitor YacG [Burkholderiaceae bacterium]